MSEDLISRVTGVIAKTQKIPPETVTIDKSFEELKIDSLDGINILFALEGEFDVDIPDDAARGIRTVREMVEGIEKLLAAKSQARRIGAMTCASRRGHRHRRDFRFRSRPTPTSQAELGRGPERHSSSDPGRARNLAIP